jgi:MSHA biogenesis protein MshJ
MGENWEKWQQKINALSVRERAIILMIVVVVAYFILQSLLIDPVIDKRKKIAHQLQVMQQDVTQQQSQREVLTAQLAVGIDKKKIKQFEAFQLELNMLNKRIDESVKAMIPPKEMAVVLEGLLEKGTDLKLLSLENKAVYAVVNKDEGGENSQKKSISNTVQETLYNHGFILRLSGNYMSVIDYFESLSALPWRFYWDDLRYKVESYPNAEITLEIHTISTYEEWIGV